MKQNRSRNFVWVFENLEISDSKVFSGSVLSDPISFRSVPNIGFLTFSVSYIPLQKDYVLYPNMFMRRQTFGILTGSGKKFSTRPEFVILGTRTPLIVVSINTWYKCCIILSIRNFYFYVIVIWRIVCCTKYNDIGGFISVSPFEQVKI